MKNLIPSGIEVAPLPWSFVAMRELPFSGFLDNTAFAFQG
jgi:hypothetical protein